MTDPLPTGLPVWVALLALLLTGGTGAALFQLLSTRATLRSNRPVTDSTSRLNDVTALGKAIESLSAEHGRAVDRIKALEDENAGHQARIDILEEELRVQKAKRYELEGHLATAEARIDTLEQEVITLGGNPDGLT